MTRAVRALITAVLCMTFAAAPGAIPAHAEPAYTVADTSEQPGVTPAIPWRQLGLSDKVVLLGSDQSLDVSLPVPQGVTPTVLSGQIGSVINAANGRIDVSDGRGVYLATIPAPAGLATLPFTIDIAAAQVVDGVATLSFVLREDNPSANSCTQLSSATLSQLATSYSGPTPDPVTVADFLPGYLDQIVIRVGDNPSAAQQQAALSLVANLTRLYRPIPTRIDVDTTPADIPLAPAPTGPRRVITILDGGRAGLSVSAPGTPAAALNISGTGDELTRQVELFSDKRYALAQSPSAAVTAAPVVVAKTGTVKSFGELGMTGQVSVLGTATLYVGFDADQFGLGSIEAAHVHLRANYTPVIGGEGSVLVRAGSTVVATHVLDQSGVLDIEGDIPADSIRSNIGLGIEVRYLPKQDCAPLNDRITFAIDPASTVSVTSGFHNRGGFGVLPMAFTPDFDVAIDKPDHIRFAAAAINLMSQQTSVPLQPRLVSIKDGAASENGLLIVAPGDELTKQDLRPPLLIQSNVAVTVNGAPTTDIALNGPTGALEAFTDRGRTVLALSGVDDWALVERSLDYVRGLDSRWGSLTGDVVATGAAAKTVNLTIREGGPLKTEYPGDGWKWWAWASGALAVLAVLTAVTFVAIRRRRRRVSA